MITDTEAVLNVSK